MDKGALKSFGVAVAAETAIATAFTAVAVLHANVDVRMAIVSACVFVVLKNVALRGVKFFVDWRCGLAEGFERTVIEYASMGLSSLCALQLANIDSLTRNVLVHEYGHVAAGHLVYSNVRFKVAITGMSQGVTMPHPISGKSVMGFKFSRPVMSAGGPLLSLICVCAMVAIAHFYGDAYDGFDGFLYTAAFMTIFQHIKYAASALTHVCGAGHDFAVMAAHGIDPRLWIAAFALIPLVTLIALEIHKSCFSTSSNCK